MIPLFHDFTDETVLVVGGGPVGARKARRFATEASVVVLGPEFGTREFGAADCVRAKPEPEDAAEWVARTDPALVVAATDDDAVNDAFAEAARDAGALVNRADKSSSRGGGDAASGDADAATRDADGVVVPATVDDDPVTVAISTSGGSPALAKHLREQLEDELAGAGAMAELTADLRADLEDAGIAPERRREAVRAVVRSDAVWKALRGGSSNPRKTAEGVVADAVGEIAWST